MSIRPGSIPMIPLSKLKASDIPSPFAASPGMVTVTHNRRVFCVGKGATSSHGFYYTATSELWPGYRVVDSVAKLKALIRMEGAQPRPLCYGGPMDGKRGPFAYANRFTHPISIGERAVYHLHKVVRMSDDGTIEGRYAWVLDGHPLPDLDTVL